MNPEDRVLVGVINRKRDLTYAQQDHWYRIPQARMTNGVHAEYIAFFTSGRVFGELSGGIHYYAPTTGLELAYRRDLLPREANHTRADETYFRVALGEFQQKQPPILNPSRRPITFIYTTWDRFVHATQIRDLYSTLDYYVDRIYHALRSRGITPDRTWDAERYVIPTAPGLSVLCENGRLDFSTRQDSNTFYLDSSQPEDKILKRIREEIQKRGGPALINIPVDRR